MHASSRRFLASSLALVLALSVAESGSAQDDVTAARDLYRAAAYDDALAVLNRLHGSWRPPEEDAVVEQYRAFCLLALGRVEEAQRAMEAAVMSAPAYHLSADDAPPRVRAAFGDARRRMLPTVIQRKYSDAKAAFDRKESAAAASGFKEVLALLADPDVAAAISQPPLSNLRALAMDFTNLSEATAAPPRELPKPSVPPLAVPPPQAAPSPAISMAARIYGADDAEVVPPVTVRQVLPPVGDVFAVRQGTVEVIIDATGAVEAAVMRTPVNPVYDRLVLSAAKTWRYRAATLDGTPVKFRKFVKIDIKAR